MCIVQWLLCANVSNHGNRLSSHRNRECGTKFRNWKWEMIITGNWSRDHWLWGPRQTCSGRSHMFWKSRRGERVCLSEIVEGLMGTGKHGQALTGGASFLYRGRKLSRAASVRTCKTECVHQTWHPGRGLRILTNFQLPKTVWEKWNRGWFLTFPSGFWRLEQDSTTVYQGRKGSRAYKQVLDNNQEKMYDPLLGSQKDPELHPLSSRTIKVLHIFSVSCWFSSLCDGSSESRGPCPTMV